MSIGMLWTMNCYGMDGDREQALISPVASNARTWSSWTPSSSSMNCNYLQCTRPKISAKTYDRLRKTVMYGSALFIVGMTGYYIGSTCQKTTNELQDVKDVAGDIHQSFLLCTSVAEECTETLVNLTDFIKEHCNQ